MKFGNGETGGADALSVSPRVGLNWRKLLAGFPASGMATGESLQGFRASRKARATGRRMGMDITWVTDRIAVGGGIWNAENMAAVSRAGITHIIDMQIEFDDTPLAEPHGIAVCWNPVDDDFEPKAAAVWPLAGQIMDGAHLRSSPLPAEAGDCRSALRASISSWCSKAMPA